MITRRQLWFGMAAAAVGALLTLITHRRNEDLDQQVFPAFQFERPGLTRASEADILQNATTCLDQPPYPADGGPTCLRRDGSWIVYEGWGGPYRGRFRVLNNEVWMYPPPNYGWRIAFFRDPAGVMWIQHRRVGSEEPPVPMRPYPEAEFLRRDD